MSKRRLWAMSCLVSVFCALAVVGSTTDTFTTIKTFYGADGSNPSGTLVQGWRSNLYGTTSGQFTNSAGTVFHITSTGTGRTLYSFCSQPNCIDGKEPNGLVQATDGNFYGTTDFGGTGSAPNDGPNSGGTVFKITPTGTLTTLYSFCSQPSCTDGFFPSGLAQATDGNFYGTTGFGGTGPGIPGNGTVFKITPTGTLTTLYSFCSQPNCSDGANPFAGLVQASDGNFYGTTAFGGTNSAGNVFKITPAGTLTTLHQFCSQPNCSDGDSPYAELVQATDGNFYGTTTGGGTKNGGTVFKITPTGTLTTLYSFCPNYPNCFDGYDPNGLVQATDGNFYGTTLYGGINDGGTIFQITPTGTLTTLYSFCSQPNCSDGYGPFAGLVQATDGNFYGTTEVGGHGGAFGDGTVFSLATGLGPFVTTLPSSGLVGRGVKILGNNLTAATNVTFNGTPATFTVVSSTELTTTVPTGATTGTVEVTTSSGSLSSNVAFRVRPNITGFLPGSGAVGSSVVISGRSLSGATAVRFGGVNATSFTVDSDTQITATVPAGAATGTVSVMTPGGFTASAGTFTVTM